MSFVRMKKLLLFVLTIFLVLAVPLGVLAEKPTDPGNTPPVLPDLPEVSGIYKDPGNPNLLVRVFVDHPRGKSQVAVANSCVDPDSLAVVGSAGWKLPISTWTYNLNPASVPVSVGSDNLKIFAAKGFAEWNDALTTLSAKPSLVPGSDTTKLRSSYDGLNIVSWGRTSGSALATTYVRYYTSSGQVVDVDTIMNKKFPWSWNVCGGTSYDAQAVLTHEQGHWYGLDDEYGASFVNNTMYGYGSQGDLRADTLANGDKQGVQAIYR